VRVFISAGEASGDALGASLLHELQKSAPDVEAFGMGGPRMTSLGFRAIEDSNAIGVVGVLEVLRHLPRLFALNRTLAERAIGEKPDVAVLIDVPDFNLRLARRLKRANIPVVFYVGPSVWAWRKWRIRSFARAVDRMLVLFPFEVDVWKEAGVDVVCVGHPLLDEIPEPAPGEVMDGKTIALLPGSRRSEIARHLGPMLEAASLLKGRGLVDRFVLPVAPGLDPRLFHAMIDAYHAAVLKDAPKPKIDLVMQSAGDPMPRRRAIAQASVALVASGTATLETALLGRPQVIVYRVSGLTYAIARLLARVKHLGLVNLIAGREIAKELLQGALTPPALADAAALLLRDDRARQDALLGYDEVRRRIGDPGASSRAAESVLALARRAGR
jgi:lipid-A-disaccharide synthase